MKLAARLRSWLRASFQRSRLEQDMDTELRFHIERCAEDLVRSGLSEDEARRRARSEFGVMEARKDECREALGLRLLDDLRADLLYAWRMLQQSPAFSTVAILSLALGIGANTAIFSLMEAALWKTIPVKEPEQLRLLSWVSGPKALMNSTWGDWKQTPAGGNSSTVFSYAVFQEMRRRNTGSPDLFAFKPSGRITAVIDSHAELVNSELVSGNFYDGVGVSTITGRSIGVADDVRTGAEVVAVISDAFWSRRFGRDVAVLGRRISLNQIPVIIIGVNPPGFKGMQPGQDPDVFLPLSAQPAILPKQHATNGALLDDPDYWWLLIMLRLPPGVSEPQTEAELDVKLRDAVRHSLPDRMNRDMPRMRLITGSRGLDELREEFSKPLVVLISLVGVVLLIACANLANLLLARATARQREISLRLALGAGRWRIVRQMLTEGLVLAFLGGAAGLLLGFWTRNGIPSLLATPWKPGPFQAQFDSQVLLISLGLTFLTGILFSMAPAWQSTRVQVNAALKDGVRSTASLPKLLAGRSLVIFQIGLSLLLLIGAGLFIRTLTNLKSASLGFRPERILLFHLDPPRTRYPGDRLNAVFLRLEEGIRAIPGIESATLSESPLVANSASHTTVTLVGRPSEKSGGSGGASRGASRGAWINDVGDRFFETMGIPILYGRSLGPHNRPDSPREIVVNQQLVRNLFPDGDAVGKSVVVNSNTYQIVGICGDARYDQIRGPVPPTFYRSFMQAHDLDDMTFEVKTAASAASILKSVREVVRTIDKDLPVFDVRTQNQQIDETLSRERIFAALTSGFGVLALILASVGIYGVMAYAVARRTSEIGVRMALGAQRRQVLAMILRETALLAGLGIAIGAIAAAGLTRYVRNMLYGLIPYDPLTVCGAILLLLCVALAAGWRPARRASRLDPMVALRHE